MPTPEEDHARSASSSSDRPVIHFVLNEVEKDARVRKIARSAAAAGYPVVYFGASRQIAEDPPDVVTRAEPLDGLPRYLLNIPRPRLYNMALDLLNLLNPLHEKDGTITDSLRAAFESSDAAAWKRAQTALLTAPYGAVFLAHRVGLLRSAPSLRRITRTVSCLRSIFKMRPRLIHAHDLPAFRLIAPPAWAKGVPVVYDSHELETGRNAPMWSRRHRALYNLSEKGTIRFATRVVTVSPGIARILRDMYGISTPEVLVNSHPKTHIQKNRPIARRLDLPQDSQVILYLGSVTLGRGLRPLFEVFGALPETTYLVFLGSVAPTFESEFRQLLESIGPLRRRVRVLEPVPYDNVVSEAFGADVGFNGLELQCRSYQNALPNKFFEYVFADVPTISTEVSDIVNLVSEYQLGQIYRDGRADQLLEELRFMLGPNRRPIPPSSREAFIEQFCWETQERTLTQMYSDIFAARA